MQRETLKKQQLADRFGVDGRTITNWMDHGLPHHMRSGRPVFVWHECRIWRESAVQRAALARASASAAVGPLDKARLRRALAEAGRTEARLARERGELIAVDAHEAVVIELVEQLRAVLVNAPGTYSVDLERLGVSAADAERVLESIMLEITRALRTVADDLEAGAQSIEDETARAPA